MGDDTWQKLYDDSSFVQSYPYPSFDVYDLHTVDNGCITHLFPLLNQTDQWDILIAHFLGKRKSVVCFFLDVKKELIGVDHVGHRYHMNHPIIEKKLNQINNVITNVTSFIKNNNNERTMLLVFGDHGMTSSGDHGGATIDEITAALFAYSTHDLHPRSQEVLYSNVDSSDTIASQYDKYPIVPQVNLVPTLSLLLGIPIPFGNIGSIIPDFFFSNETVSSWNILLDSLKINSLQVCFLFILGTFTFVLSVFVFVFTQIYNYLTTYTELAGTFSPEELQKLQNTLELAMQSDVYQDAIKYYKLLV